MKPQTRKWLYGVLIASAPLVVYYGIATQQEVTLWVVFAGAALGIAYNNVTPKK
jgi:hypothetical protein